MRATLHDTARTGASQLEAELDRAKRIEASLSNPADVNIIHRYIAELEGRMRVWRDAQRRNRKD